MKADRKHRRLSAFVIPTTLFRPQGSFICGPTDFFTSCSPLAILSIISNQCRRRHGERGITRARYTFSGLRTDQSFRVVGNSEVKLPDKPVAHREQAPEAIHILPAPDVGAATVAARAPAQVAVRTFIVRLMSQGSEIRNREIHI